MAIKSKRKHLTVSHHTISPLDDEEHRQAESLTEEIVRSHQAPLPVNTRLSPTASQLLKDREGGFPVWIRSPKSGPEHYTGFSRSKLYELAGNRLIRSVSIRQPGQTKGVRLFHLASILEFVERCETAANRQEGA